MSEGEKTPPRESESEAKTKAKTATASVKGDFKDLERNTVLITYQKPDGTLDCTDDNVINSKQHTQKTDLSGTTCARFFNQCLAGDKGNCKDYVDQCVTANHVADNVNTTKPADALAVLIMFEFKDIEGNTLSNNNNNKEVQSYDEWAKSNVEIDGKFASKLASIDTNLKVPSILKVLVDIVNKHAYILDKDVCKKSSKPDESVKHPLGFRWARKLPNNCERNLSNKTERVATLIKEALSHESPCSSQLGGGSANLDKVGLQKQFEKNTESYSELLKEEYEELKEELTKRNKTINNTDNQKIFSMYSKLKSHEDKLRAFRNTMLEYLSKLDNNNNETINTESMLKVIQKYDKLRNKATNETQNLNSVILTIAKALGI